MWSQSSGGVSSSRPDVPSAEKTAQPLEKAPGSAVNCSPSSHLATTSQCGVSRVATSSQASRILPWGRLNVIPRIGYELGGRGPTTAKRSLLGRFTSRRHRYRRGSSGWARRLRFIKDLDGFWRHDDPLDAPWLGRRTTTLNLRDRSNVTSTRLETELSCSSSAESERTYWVSDTWHRDIRGYQGNLPPTPLSTEYIKVKGSSKRGCGWRNGGLQLTGIVILTLQGQVLEKGGGSD